MADRLITDFPAAGSASQTDEIPVYKGGSSQKITVAQMFAAGTTDDITEGSTNKYYTDEKVDDRVSALIQNGTGITWSYNDGAGTLTPTVSITQYTDEMAQDAVGGALTDSSIIDFTYNDVAGTITATVIDASLTYSKIQNVTDERLLGRSAGSAGSIQEITIGSGLSLSGGSLTATGGGSYTDENAQDAIGGILTDTATIDFTYDDATPTITADVKNDSITFAKMQNITSDRLIGRDTASSGDPEEISVGTGLSFSGSGSIQCDITQYTDELAQDAIGAMVADTATIDVTYTDITPELKWDVKANSISETYLTTSVAGNGLAGGNGTALSVNVDNSTIEINTDSLRVKDDGITFAKIQNITDARLLGRSAGSAGDMQEITVGSGLSLSAGALTATGGGGGSAFFDDDGSTPSVAPSATGTDAIAIGDGAAAAGNYGYALGNGASAATTKSIAFGFNSSANTSAQAIAIGGGDASGAGVSFTDASAARAIAIGANSATSTGSAKTIASAIGAIAIGGVQNTGASNLSTAATAVSAIAIGSTSSNSPAGVQATGSSSIAIGGSSGAGASARATGVSGIALGGTNGGNSGANSTGECAIAIGGAKTGGVGAAASQDACIAIGGNRSSSGGAGANASANGCIAIGGAGSSGSGAAATNAGGNIAIGSASSTGNAASSSGTCSIAIGSANSTSNGPVTTHSGGIAIGGTVGAVAACSTGGNGATAIGGGTSTGANASAGGAASVAIGGGSSTNACATASGTASVAIGGGSSTAKGPAASGENSFATGYRAVANKFGMLARACGAFSADGDAQYEQFILRVQTTNNTGTEVTSNAAAAGSSNTITLASGKVVHGKIYILAKEAATGDCAAFHREFLIKNIGGTTALVGSVLTIGTDLADTGALAWTVAITADNTNDRVAVTVTGETAKTINWIAVCEIETLT